MKFKNHMWMMTFIAVITLALAGCSPIKNALHGPSNPVEVPSVFNKDLAALFPEKPAKWIYSGIAEYGHVMVLDEVSKSKSQKVYKISGEVEDVSGGESNRDYTFNIAYVVYNDRVEQIKEGEMLLDSDFDKITMIKLPLEVGTSWEETVTDETGKSVHINAEITDISKDSSKIYTVRYEDTSSDYYEIRKIQEGQGVVAFEKVMFYNGDAFPVQYGLFKLDRALDQTDLDDSPVIEDVKLDEDDATVLELDLLPENESAQVSSEDGSDLRALIQSFNDAWVHFANEEDMSVLDYVTPDGDAYKIIQKFPAGTMILTFETIDITDIRVEGDYANVFVHEVIRKIKDGRAEMLDYHWIYDVRRSDGIWRIHSYINEAQ